MTPRSSFELRVLSSVRLLSLDVDGVLTDGQKFYTADGLSGLSFDARDGLGIDLLHRANIIVVIVSNGDAAIVRKRAEDLGITHCSLGVYDKGKCVREICLQRGVRPEEAAHLGDDLWDLAAFDAVGIRLAVANAHPSVLARAHCVTAAGGGRGAVREVADAILEAKGVDPASLLPASSSAYNRTATTLEAEPWRP